MTTSSIEPLGDGALLIRLGDSIDAATNRTAIALAGALCAADIFGVRDIAPAYASVCVRYEMSSADFATISTRLRSIVDSIKTAEYSVDTDVTEIPVCYGGKFGPDLDAVAAHASISVDHVIDRHVDANYEVAMLGFMPGFPYLRGLDPTLHTPRLATPRTRVPAGSVAIGGAQTGIYPRELPGGWRIIGRTPLRLFDSARETPALLSPGQKVRFTRIGPDEFAAMRR
ncbi:MAG TPA: 5-oxoprolinase subunit PxpB [Rudaea sp.]|nr:5-oxoprolinase subunit PxpB [Rudaea sp.]